MRLRLGCGRSQRCASVAIHHSFRPGENAVLGRVPSPNLIDRCKTDEFFTSRGKRAPVHLRNESLILRVVARL